MAILAIFTGKGLTKKMYEDLRREVGWEREHPSGGILHASSFDEAGNIHVADIWESEEQMNAFVQNRLIPTMQKLNVPPPQAEVYPIHTVQAYSAIEQYRL